MSNGNFVNNPTFMDILINQYNFGYFGL